MLEGIYKMSSGFGRLVGAVLKVFLKFVSGLAEEIMTDNSVNSTKKKKKKLKKVNRDG